MNEMDFTPLESKVLEWLLDGEDPVLEVLREQYGLSKVASREYTGVGFYLYFEVKSTKNAILDASNVKKSFCFGDVDVVITSGAKHQRVGFLLWIENGYLHSLEAYTYGLEKWPVEIDEFQLRYLGNHRDLNDLRQNWVL